MLRISSTVALCLIACRAAPPASAADESGSSLRSSPNERALKLAILQDDAQHLVAELANPAALVVLDADRHVLAAAGAHGAQAQSSAWRPGSTMKPLLALLAARAGRLDPAARYTCTREYPGMQGFHCIDAHGPVDLQQALEVSCNNYFWDLASKIGLPEIQRGFGALGFGRKTGLSAGEVDGVLPTPAMLAAQRGIDGQAWPGWALLMGTGHGPIQVTPLQLANAYAQLAKELTDPSLPADDPKRQILAGLIRVVEGEHGTGRAAHVATLSIAGKTGTAEAGPFGADASDQNNGWFVGFAPAEAPRWIVAVMVEGQTGAQAAPVAGRMFERLTRGHSAAGG